MAIKASPNPFADLAPVPVINKSDEKPETPAPLRNDDLVNLASKNAKPTSKLKLHKAPEGPAKQNQSGKRSEATSVPKEDSNKEKVKAKILVGAAASLLVLCLVADVLIILILTKIIHYPFLQQPSK